MDLRSLRYFVGIVDSGSLTEASRRLHIVQPALSQRLSRLEQELGVELLVRGRAGVAVTEAGAELYQRAQAILKQLESAASAVREKAGVARGPVAVGILRSAAPVLGAPLYQAIRRELPDVVPEIASGYSADLMNRLRAMRLDLTMCVQSRDERIADATPLYRERLCVVGPPALVGPAPDALRLRDLAGVPLLLSAMQPRHGALLAAARGAGIALSIVGGIEDSPSTLEVCAAGLAATVLPESGARRAAARRGLAVRALDEPAFEREIVLVTNRAAAPTGAVAAVEAILARLATELITAA